MSNFERGTVIEDGIRPDKSRRVHHLTALSMFLAFALVFVAPALLTTPRQQPVPPQTNGALGTEIQLGGAGQESSTSTGPADFGPSEYCEPALGVAFSLSGAFLNTASGSADDLVTIIEVIQDEIGSSYTGPDPVRQAMAAIYVSAKRAISPARTSLELTSQGLSNSLSRPFTTDAVKTILSRCQ